MRKLFFILLFFAVKNLYAQESYYSFTPYSVQGIGLMSGDFFSKNMGMANTGIAHFDMNSINLLNPALLEKNKFTVADFNFGFQSNFYKQDTSLNRQTQYALKSLALAMPLSYKWTMAFSLRPASYISYNASAQGLINGDSTRFVNNKINASGGVQRLGWANGINIFKGLNIGAEVGFNFGNKIMIDSTSIDDIGRKIIMSEEHSILGVDCRTGISYTYDFTKKSNKDSNIVNKMSLTFGFIYDIQNRWNVNTIRLVDYGSSVYGDTTRSTLKMPQGIGFGISLINEKRWGITSEVYWQQWSKFTGDMSLSATYNNQMRISFGAEYKPKIDLSKQKINILQKAVYRGGLYYNSSPYIHNNNPVNEIGIHFGIGFADRTEEPSYRWQSRNKFLGYASKYNIGFAVGKMGTGNVEDLGEYFIKLNMGASLNSDWFKRRRLN